MNVIARQPCHGGSEAREGRYDLCVEPYDGSFPCEFRLARGFLV